MRYKINTSEMQTHKYLTRSLMSYRVLLTFGAMFVDCTVTTLNSFFDGRGDVAPGPEEN